MARANAMAMFGTLDDVAHALGIPLRKDKAGAAVMKKLSIPKGFGPDGEPIWREGSALSTVWRRVMGCGSPTSAPTR